jgi:hypothetical protein
MHAGILGGKREEHGQLGVPKLRWDDNIQMDLKEGLGWSFRAQNRDKFRAAVYSHKPSECVKLGEFLL